MEFWPKLSYIVTTKGDIPTWIFFFRFPGSSEFKLSPFSCHLMKISEIFCFWKSIHNFLSYIQKSDFFFTFFFVFSFFLRISPEPHIWATAMRLVSNYSECVDLESEILTGFHFERKLEITIAQSWACWKRTKMTKIGHVSCSPGKNRRKTKKATPYYSKSRRSE